jgi:hypothetical protein
MLSMPSRHAHPSVTFRPDPDLYARARAALAGATMQAYLVEALRYLAGDIEGLDRPGPQCDGQRQSSPVHR